MAGLALLCAGHPGGALTAIDVLDVNAVLTFANTAGPLAGGFCQGNRQNGAWIVAWQDDVVDPTGIVPLQLLAGREKGQPTPFWKLKVLRFANIKPKHIADAPPIATAIQANFGNQLLLHGYTVLDNGDLLLFWERPASGPAAAADIQITGQISTTAGAAIAKLADQRPAGYAYPVARWPVGKLVMGRSGEKWLGNHVTDGTYRLHLSVYALTAGGLHKLLCPTDRILLTWRPSRCALIEITSGTEDRSRRQKAARPSDHCPLPLLTTFGISPIIWYTFSR